MPQKEQGRPASPEGREERELRVYDLLDALHIAYARVDHPAVMTMEDLTDISRILGAPMCKNLFLCNAKKTQYYLLLMPAEKPFKTRELREVTGRLSFAQEDRLLAYMDIRPGAVSVMGLMNDRDSQVGLLIDEDLKDQPLIGVHPCVNTTSLALSTADLLRTFLPAVHHEPVFVKLTGK